MKIYLKSATAVATNKINASLEEDNEVLAEGAFILLVYIDDIPCGYYVNTKTDRGSQWITTILNPTDQCMRFNKASGKHEINAEEILIVPRIGASGKMLDVVFTQDDNDRMLDNDYIQLSTKYHTVYGETVAYSDAEAISSDVIEDFWELLMKANNQQ